MITPDGTGGAPALVVGAAIGVVVAMVDVVDVVVAGGVLGLRFGLGFEFEFGGGISVAAEAETETGGKEVEVAVEADEVGSVLLDEREFQLVVLRSAMDYAAIGIGDTRVHGAVL